MKEKIKKFLKYNYKLIILYAVLLSLVLIKLDYQIYAPGGLIDLSNKVYIKDSYKSEGSFNLTYVRGLKGNLLFVLLSHIVPSWDLVSTKDIRIEGETEEESNARNKVYLDDVNKNAVIVAYNALGKEVNIENVGVKVVSIYSSADTDMEIGDIITSVNNIEIKKTDEFISIVSSLKEGQKINLKVLRKNKEKDCYATLRSENNTILIGIVIENEVSLSYEPDIKFKFKRNELGPSGGLMTSLKIYDMLTKEDITHGYKISGTGTINSNGVVGAISGIKYKIAGAVNKNAQIFICPTDNYEECVSEVNKNNYNIKLIEGDNFNNVLLKLKSLPYYDK